MNSETQTTNSFQLDSIYHCSNRDLFKLAEQCLGSQKVDLICTDPPYHRIVKEEWDNQHTTDTDFGNWLTEELSLWSPLLSNRASLAVFCALGSHGVNPLFELKKGLEKAGFYFRNWLTWKKSRAYGKSHDYLYCREEILWFSKSQERTEVIFNKPLSEIVRGYGNKKHPNLSPYKRISNVITETSIVTENTSEFPENFDYSNPIIEGCPEPFKPIRVAEKPRKLMDLLISTHSNIGNLVVDPFMGSGSTLVSCKSLGRNYLGCDLDLQAYNLAKLKLSALVAKQKPTHSNLTTELIKHTQTPLPGIS